MTVTRGGSSTSSPTSTPSPTTTTVPSRSGDVTVECPSADGLNYTVPGMSKVFKRQCNVNYAGGEGEYGLLNDTILSMEDCINACARESECVGVNFNYSPQCWLKQFIGIKSSGAQMESAVLWQ